MSGNHSHDYVRESYSFDGKRAIRVGISGPVGSGKTALVDRLSKRLLNRYNLAVVTNDIYTREDAEFLLRQGTLPMERVRGVETGGCPHTAIREDASMNLEAVYDLENSIEGLELVFIESGGDNLATAFSPELADIFIFVIDVAGGDKVPRKGGPGIMRSDLLVINKIDLAPYVGASLEVMDRDARKMRGEKPFVFTNLKDESGLDRLIAHLEQMINSLRGIPVSNPVDDLRALLPPRYQNDTPVSAAPMPAADLIYDADGRVAWDQIWGSFCDLALAGGPPHRGTLLEPVAPEIITADPEGYQRVLAELERGITMITKLPIVASKSPGWIGIQCTNEEMALWLLRAIVVENISVRREGSVIYLPVGPGFRLEEEIKNVITVIAKTHHYWTEHAQTV